MDIVSTSSNSNLEYVGGLFGKVGGSLLEFELEDSYFFGSIISIKTLLSSVATSLVMLKVIIPDPRCDPLKIYTLRVV